MLIVAGNFAVYLNDEDKENYKYNYSYVPVATALIYGLGFGTPICLAVLMKCFGTDITVF